MPDILTFAMCAPLGAMGGVTLGSNRPTWQRPARSAILGLLGACIGADRQDEEAHQSLQSGYGVAMLVEREGSLLVDFHTAQAAESERGVSYGTRAEELRSSRLGTMVTRREYRTDPLVLVAVWARGPSPRWPLSVLATHMAKPRFVPYFGRRACPFSLPFGPMVVAAGTPGEALLTRRQDGPEGRILDGTRRTGGYLAMDEQDAAAAGLPASRIETRRDNLHHRGKWLFALRREAIIPLPDPVPAVGSR